MRAERARTVPDAAWQFLVDKLWPGARFRSAEPLVGGLGGLLDRVRATAPDGTERRVDVRRFFPEWREDDAAVQRAMATLMVLEEHEVHAPRGLWGDGTGKVLGRPALVMTDLPGRPVAASLDLARAEVTGRLLAGQPETFRHDDFHPGNVLRDGADAYVVDLSWAGRGDPGRDVGYCRLDLALTSEEGTQEAFLDGYRAGGGTVPEHLWLYDLMGALRSLPTPAHWLPAFHELGRTDLTAQQFESRARAFVSDALARGRAAGVLGTLAGDDVRAGSNG